MSQLIRLVGIAKSYAIEGAAAVEVLHDIDLRIASGEFVAIMGASGSGKSTLMNILGCLDTPTRGGYFLDGRDISGLSADELARVRLQLLGFVFQNFNLLPRVTVRDNVALPLLYAGVDRRTRRLEADRLLHRVGLAGLGDRRPNQLSGGQQQRVAIARALVNQPRLLLADEPTGNLDSETGLEVMSLFRQLNEQDGITLIVVTHEADIAAYAGRRIRVRDGRIVEDEGTGPTR